MRDSEPKLLSYDELVQLSLDQEISPELAEKRRLITTTSFINNEAYLNGGKPRPLEIPQLGPSLRVALWNIERGLELDYIELFLGNKEVFMAKVEEERKKAKENNKSIRSVDLGKIPEEIEILKSADVWILNEADWGVKRTEYREVARELGKALNMNWAYGVEFWRSIRNNWARTHLMMVRLRGSSSNLKKSSQSTEIDSEHCTEMLCSRAIRSAVRG